MIQVQLQKTLSAGQFTNIHTERTNNSSTYIINNGAKIKNEMKIWSLSTHPNAHGQSGEVSLSTKH